eukprot:16435445-Heterocapsa_arctica.AAC.1
MGERRIISHTEEECPVRGPSRRGTCHRAQARQGGEPKGNATEKYGKTAKRERTGPADRAARQAKEEPIPPIDET